MILLLSSNQTKQKCDFKSNAMKYVDISTCSILGHAVAKLVETLCYKPEDRGFDSR
jgi:hypothetical protein